MNRIETQLFVKPFRTPSNTYVYDGNTNMIFRISEDVFSYLNNMECLSEIDRFSKSQEISQMRIKYGAFSDTHPMIISFPENAKERELLVRKSLTGALNQLVLNVTDRCNFKCSYCQQRLRFTNREMPISIGQIGIDFFIDNNRNTSKMINISYYGGEPLLNIDFIDDCCNYAMKKHRGMASNLTFNVTTNGYLLNGRTLDILRKYNFHIVISLDGPQQIHDQNRRLKNGSGTFGIVWNNIIDFARLYPSYFEKKVAIVATYIPRAKGDEMKQIWSLFRKSPVLMKRLSRFVIANLDNVPARNEASSEALISNMHSLFRIFCAEIVHGFSIGDRVCSALFAPSLLEIHFRELKMIASTIPSKGQCIPGTAKLFIDCDGSFRPCEKEPATLRIGDVETGFDYKEISNFLGRYSRYLKYKCAKCWAVRLCYKCIGTTGINLDSDPLDESSCNQRRMNIENQLVAYCYIREQNDGAFNGFSPPTKNINKVNESQLFL